MASCSSSTAPSVLTAVATSRTVPSAVPASSSSYVPHPSVLFPFLLLTCYCCSLSFLSFLSCSSSFFSPSTCTCTCSPCKHLTDLALVPRTKHTPCVRIARPVDCDGLLRCECFSLFSLVQIMIKFPVNFLIEARQMKLLPLIESLHAA